MGTRWGFTSVLALLLMLGGAAGALNVDFEMGDGSSIDTSDTADALEMWANVYGSVGDEAFTLGVGDSYTFLFAQMGTFEDWVQADDLVTAGVTAYLDFELPSLTGDVSGATTGFYGGLFGANQGWDLVWNDPVLVNFGGNGLFQIELSDASYRSGLWTGPDGSCGHAYADIYATITLLECPTPPAPFDPVPEPATMSLLGVGLMGLVLRKRFGA